ncbi:MAG: RHS repeat-associated core domain-containing protein, partial [Chloroflexi bacterium]|nr:RHS repeat-associated core domain-containing protein [Chloroflexota bacterium]
TRNLSDGTGAVLASYTYGAFGNLRLIKGSSDNTFQFTGEQTDDETGLLYLRARYYDPSVGRFISKDRLPGRPTDSRSLNQFVYARNNPVNLTDLSGLEATRDDNDREDYKALAEVGLDLVLKSAEKLGKGVEAFNVFKDTWDLLHTKQYLDKVDKARDGWEEARYQYGRSSPEAEAAYGKYVETWLFEMPVVGTKARALFWLLRKLGERNPVYSEEMPALNPSFAPPPSSGK